MRRFSLPDIDTGRLKDCVRRLAGEIRRITPEKVWAVLKRSAVKIKNSAQNTPLGFRAGIAVLLVCAIVVTPIAFYVQLSSETGSENRFDGDAAQVCAKIIGEYGSAKTELADTSGDIYRMSGLSFAREVDFDDDGNSELLIAYRNGSAYQVEVWGYDSGDFARLYSNSANVAMNHPEVGSWISLYRHSGKFYIGELSAEDGKTMSLLTLHGSKFKSSSECEYDPVNDIYAVNGEMNTSDFETVKLSNLSEGKAEYLLDSVSAAIDSFGTTDSGALPVSAKSGEQLMAEAYSEIVQNYALKYGEPEYDSSSRVCYAKGLCVADLIDFNGDGVDELFTIYRFSKKVSATDENGEHVLKSEPEYKAEVHMWNGNTAVKAFEIEGISEMQDKDSSDGFYILRKNGSKTDICKNTYVYNEKTTRVWKGTSRISEMDEDGTFSPVFIAEINSNYGYETYQINGERVYRREFNTDGYVVPYFCNDDEYDTNEYTVVYLQGKSNRGSDIQKRISQTQKNIEDIRSAASV